MKTIMNIKNGSNAINHKLKCILVLCFFLLTQNSCKETICEYDNPKIPPECNGGMDVTFVIDYTGSMGAAINNMKASITNIVNTIDIESNHNFRLALTIFDEHSKTNSPAYLTQSAYTSLPVLNKLVVTTGPTTNQYLTIMDGFGPIGSSTTFAAQLAKLNVVGTMALGNGVGGAEPGDLLIDRIVNPPFAAGTWRSGVTKLVIIITDNNASGVDDIANAIDDAALTTLAGSPPGIQYILISSQATGSSNYETKLISNNPGGLKLMSANFANIAPDIITMIENLCENNGKIKP